MLQPCNFPLLMKNNLTAIQNATTVDACELFDLPSFTDDRGTLAFLEGGNHIPFPIVRVFYLYGLPAGSVRAAHALKSCSQVVIAVRGSFTIDVSDGERTREFTLSDPAKGVLLPPKIWREIRDFSADAVCLVMASEPYDANGYYPLFDEYVAAVRGMR